MQRHTTRILITFTFVAALLCAPGQAQAGVERAYRGKIVLLRKRPPLRFRSNAAFAQFLKTQRVDKIWPKDKKKQDRWRLEFFAFFRGAPNDVEVKIKFYDITEGRRFVAGDSIYVSSRQQRILASHIELEKPRFNINRRYVMYITNARGQTLASTSFRLNGKAESYSGRVTFTEDETRR